MSRFNGFKFKAPVNFRGRPAVTLPTIPARDLTERDVARLSDEEYEAVKAAKRPDGKPLYEPIRPRKGKSDDETADGDIEVEVEEVSGDEVIESDLPAE